MRHYGPCIPHELLGAGAAARGCIIRYYRPFVPHWLRDRAGQQLVAVLFVLMGSSPHAVWTACQGRQSCWPSVFVGRNRRTSALQRKHRKKRHIANVQPLQHHQIPTSHPPISQGDSGRLGKPPQDVRPLSRPDCPSSDSSAFRLQAGASYDALGFSISNRAQACTRNECAQH